MGVRWQMVWLKQHQKRKVDVDLNAGVQEHRAVSGIILPASGKSSGEAKK